MADKIAFAVYMLCIIAIAVIAATAVALAGMPPSKYDKPYGGRLVEWKVPLGRAAAKCNGLARDLGQTPNHPYRIDGRPLYGCAYPFKGECYIVWSFDPSGRDKAMADNVRRHEIGHCNGWPAGHPGAR